MFEVRGVLDQARYGSLVYIKKFMYVVFEPPKLNSFQCKE